MYSAIDNTIFEDIFLYDVDKAMHGVLLRCSVHILNGTKGEILITKVDILHRYEKSSKDHNQLYDT